MATPFVRESKRHQPLDTISHLAEVLDILKKHGYSGVDYYYLGRHLGLHPRTLNVIEENNKGDVRSCLRECLTAWLKQKDNVKSKGGPTYEILIQALRRMGEKAVANGIERDLRDAVNFNEWLKEGRVDLTVKRVQMLGLPGSGKTCSQRLLLNEDPPKEDNSTPIACRAVKATRISAHDDRMERVDAKALLSSLAHDLKEAATKQKEPPPEKDHSTESKEESLEIKTTEADLVAELAGSAEATESADTTETAADDTEANKIINEIVEAIPNAENKFDSHWVYIIDSGGQTAFQELLPLFTRPASLNIITLDLSKDINEKVKQEYRINGESFSCDSDDLSEVSYTTNIQFLKDVLSSGAILQPYHPPQPIGSKENTSTESTTSPQYVEYFVLGTHKDKANPDVITKYNDELKKLKSESEKEGYHIIRDGVIYPVNTIIKSPNRAAEAKELGKIIYHNTGSVEESKVPIPVRWFAFELTLIEKAKGCSFLPIDDVLRAGKSLQMTEAQTKEALKYLHNVTIILYYPQVLPDVVFVDPHPILDILSRLLALVITKNHHPFVKEGVRPLPSELKNLKDNGLFTKALLEKLKDDEDFPKPDFIKLLLYLHIIVETDEQDKYFLPSALPPCPKTSQPPESGINPLQIIWRSPVTNPKDSRVILPVPRGIFSLAVIKLMKCSKPLQFCFPPTSQYLRCRDAMSFRVCLQNNHIGTIHIIKKHKHIEIYFEGDASQYCSLICESVKEAITSSCEAINIKPDGYEFAFACSSSTNGCYRIVTNEDEKNVQCTLCPTPPTISGEEEYWSWFDKKSLTEVKYSMMTKEFHSLLLDAVKEALAIKSIDDVKKCLLDLIEVEDWASEVKAVKDETSLAQLLQRYCFLSNFSLLRCIAEKLGLKESKSRRIDQLAEERDAFYSKVLAEDFAAAAIEDHKMMKDHHVKMTVVVSWSSSETTLARFEDYITEEFKDLSMFIALRAVHHSCLIFECTAPIWAAIKKAIKCAADSLRNGIQQLMLNNEVTDLPEFDAKDVKDEYAIDYNDEIVYPMNKSPRGYCLIIHMSGECTEEYPNGDREPGNSKDVENLEELFKKLKFVVKSYPDLTKGKIEQLMKNVEEANLEWSCCFVMFILAHGGIMSKNEHNDGTAYFCVPKEEVRNSQEVRNGEDEENTKYKVSTIKEKIENHPHLVGKPKLLFIQTCRGDKEDPGVPERADNFPTNIEPKPIKGLIPTGSDLLIAFPTIEKYVAWRGPAGTRFILSLYDVFNMYHEKYDILTMMMIVTKRVADMFGETERKQNPAMTSTLRKFLYFGQPPCAPKSVYEDQDLCNEKAVKPLQ